MEIKHTLFSDLTRITSKYLWISVTGFVSWTTRGITAALGSASTSPKELSAISVLLVNLVVMVVRLICYNLN